MSLDLVNSLILQTQDPNRTKRKQDPVDPIYGAAPSVQETPFTPEPLPVVQVDPQPMVPMSQSQQQTAPTQQKFSEWNPVGGPPPGYKVSSSCAKCHYFVVDYADTFGVSKPGFCRKYDFPCNSGYTCDTFELPHREEVKEVFAEPAVTPVAATAPATQEVQAEQTTDLLSKLEAVGATKEVFAAPVVSTTPSAVETTVETTTENVVDNNVDVSVDPETKNESLNFSDSELYSEALALTESKFRVPDSSIAKEFTLSRYKKAFKAKYGTLDNAFK